MNYAAYGDTNGRPVVYFHGAPGAKEECSLFDQDAKQNHLRVICLDRFDISSSIQGKNYYKLLTKEVIAIAGDKKIDIIGFSIGAHVALEVRQLLGDKVREVHLISAAAPLNGGDFIDHMAGGMVFKLAKNAPFAFSLLTQYQRLMALLAPKALAAMLFASAAGQDKPLSQEVSFKQFIIPLLALCFKSRARGYIRDVLQYVGWQEDNLQQCHANVTLWHGTQDNWSPFAMASFLDQSLAGKTQLEAMQDLSHYSCLYAAAPSIFEKLGENKHA